MSVGTLEAPGRAIVEEKRSAGSFVEASTVDPLQLTFANHPIQALRQLTVTLESGTAILSGTLPSYYNVQLALETARHFDGVRKVVTRLQVVYPKPTAHKNDWQIPI